MKRYRIRLKTKRVSGPFIFDDIVNLVKQKKVTTEDFFQTFPDGDWLVIENDKDFLEALKANIEDNVKEDTFMFNLKDLKQKEVEPEPETETKTKAEPEFEPEPEHEVNEESKTFGIDLGHGEGEDSVIYEPTVINNDETVVRKVNHKTEDVDDDKTKINLDYQKYLKEQVCLLYTSPSPRD